MPRYSKEDGNILKQFGAAVKAGRDGLGISQEALAEKAGYSGYSLCYPCW